MYSCSKIITNNVEIISDASETTFVYSSTYFVDSICIGTCLKVQLSNMVQFFYSRPQAYADTNSRSSYEAESLKATCNIQGVPHLLCPSYYMYRTFKYIATYLNGTYNRKIRVLNFYCGSYLCIFLPLTV